MREEASNGDLTIGEWVPAQRSGPPVEQPGEVAPVVMRTEAVPAVPGWAESEETVALPAFLRGLPAPGAVAATTDPTAPLAMLAASVAPRPTNGTGRHAAVDTDAAVPVPAGPAVPVAAGPAGPTTEPDDDGDRLPSSERNMLIFVSSLLAAGTLAIVVMGHSALNKHASPPATITTAPATATTGPAVVGSPDVPTYCDGLPGHLRSRAPGSGHPAWSCTGTGYATVTFTPTDVCRAQYGPSARAVYTTLADTRTWRCLR